MAMRRQESSMVPSRGSPDLVFNRYFMSQMRWETVDSRGKISGSGICRAKYRGGTFTLEQIS